MNYIEFNRLIREAKLSPLYLFMGREKYLIDDTVDRIKKKYIDKSLESVNLNILNGKNTVQDDIVNACETLPFMSEKKLVILNDLGLFLEEGISDEKEFYKYLANIGDHCIFLIIDRNQELKKTTKFYKFFKKNDWLVEFDKLTKAQLQSWIEKQLKSNNKTMNKANINYFIDRSGYFNKENDTDLYNFKGELDKLISYSNSTEISKSDIESTNVKNISSTVFELIDAIGVGNGQKALHIFQQLYSLDEHPLKILTMIVRRVRLLLSYKLYSDKGYSKNQIKEKMKIHPFEFRNISNQARMHDLKKLINHYEILLETDRKYKTTSIDEKMEMELLIIRLSTANLQKN